MTQQKPGINASTIARIAGNLLSGCWDTNPDYRKDTVKRAVAMAREIAEEAQRNAEDRD